MQSLTVTIEGEILELSALKGVYWNREKMLIISDVHLGKAAYFRKHGINVPKSVTPEDLNKLADLICFYKPEKVLVTGDLVHCDYNGDLEFFERWRNQYRQTTFLLVPGNHDRLPQETYEQLGVAMLDPEYVVEPFSFIHHYKKENEKYFSLAGHLHPGITLHSPHGSKIKLPCFAQARSVLYLPAFSSFTGRCTVRDVDVQSFYVIANQSIVTIANNHQ